MTFASYLYQGGKTLFSNWLSIFLLLYMSFLNNIGLAKEAPHTTNTEQEPQMMHYIFQF